MDENNQYGNAMTKPLPTGCIKKKRVTYQIIESYNFTYGYNRSFVYCRC